MKEERKNDPMLWSGEERSGEDGYEYTDSEFWSTVFASREMKRGRGEKKGGLQTCGNFSDEWLVGRTKGGERERGKERRGRG